MPQPSPSLVGSVIERPSGSASSFKHVHPPSPSGFPSVQHRSKSAFARAREVERDGTRWGGEKTLTEVPVVRTSGELLSKARSRDGRGLVSGNGFSAPMKDAGSNVADNEEWKAQMRRDNDRAIEAMSEEERERHATEILEQLGPNVVELMQVAREARARTGVDLVRNKESEPEPRHIGPTLPSAAQIAQPTPILPIARNKFVSPPRSILSQPSSRSSSPCKSARKLRFADVTANDVHVFQSEPSSPRKPLGLLPPPPSHQDSNAKDVEMLSEPRRVPEPEEGAPEYIRRRFFPEARGNDPTLEWIESGESAPDSEPRFDLSGALIPVALRHSLHTHLGLHHHGGSSAAGYTLDELFLLARSSVPAQRATVLSVLSKLIRRLARRETSTSEVKDCDKVRSRALVLGLAALTERGTVGVQAVDLVWTCVVFWNEDVVTGLEGLELRPVNPGISHDGDKEHSEDSPSSADPISSLPFSALLPQIAALLGGRSLPPESLAQALSILLRLARHSVEIATTICQTPRLIASVVSMFLLTPIPPTDDGPHPDPLALDFLQTLALSFRGNALALEGPADALLRFITTAAPLSASPFPLALADALLRGTLNLYATLGRYGLYSSIAATAGEHFNRLSSSILQDSEGPSSELKISWLELLSIWMICARDPHRTTPPHDLLWSQVVGWTWSDDVLQFRRILLSRGPLRNRRLLGGVWDALASWLEGCRVNSPKAGQDEREIVCSAIGQAWNTGLERELINGTVARFEELLSEVISEETPAAQRKDRLTSIAERSRTLASFTGLCMACIPKHAAGFPSPNSDNCGAPSWIIDTVSMLLPLVLTLLSNDALRSIGRRTDRSKEGLSFRVQVMHMRSTSTFLASFVRLVRLVRGGSDWLPIGVASLEVLLPGDEGAAEWVIEEIVSNESSRIECAEKLQFLMPFFKTMIRPDEGFYLSPLTPTPESIQKSTTQTFPADCIRRSSAKPGISGLPLSPDWPCITLDHLLRSGTSSILTNPDSVPASWNASETDLTQASLALLLHVQRSFSRSSLPDFGPSFAHVVFNGMKVFMLEHNQQQSDSNQEVFRDPIVGRLMDDLLAPYTLRGIKRSDALTDSLDLESVAKGFLGEGTPFFQFYTDFVALYDAISFSHGNFGRLLLPPTSMAYAPDYRKLLWGDFGHTLRSIRTPIEDVLSLDLKQHFYPVESDPEILGWYIRALVKWPLDGFVRFVAVHHIACNIWLDLREGEETDAVREKRSRTLLLAVFNQAKSDVVRDIILYVQDGSSDLRVPPRCYEISGETKLARLASVRAFCETRIGESMEKIFGESG